MATWLKQSTAVDIALGPFVDSTDGFTAETGLTIAQADVRLKKNNGAWAQVNDNTSATHEENGWYEKELDATDTNTLGILIVAVNESGALPVWREFLVVPAEVYDAMISGSGTGVRADVRGWLGTAPATPTVNGVPEVDLTHIGGDAQSGTDLKDFADAGYDPATNKVEGVKLADTLTTYTGNTVQTGDSFARLGAPAGASVSADVAAVKSQTAAIETDTQDIQTKIGTPAGASVSVDIAAVKTDSAAIKAKTDNLPTDPADQSLIMDRIGAPVGASISADIAAVKAQTGAIETDTQDLQTQIGTAGDGLTDIPWNPAWDDPVAAAVWDAPIADHDDVGSTGEQLAAAGSAGDPWATALPGAYGAGSAGKIIGDNINTPLSGIKSKTDLIPASPASETTVAAVKAKTDQMVFTKANELDVNTKSINDATILGDGTPGDLFRV